MIRRDALSPVDLPGIPAGQACHMISRSSARLLLCVQYIGHAIYIPDMRMLERAFAECKGLDEGFARFGCGVRAGAKRPALQRGSRPPILPAGPPPAILVRRLGPARGLPGTGSGRGGYASLHNARKRHLASGQLRFT